jgi:hypothetical protein
MGPGEQGAGRVRGRRDDELPQPEGRAGNDARAAQRRAELDGLQQVKRYYCICMRLQLCITFARLTELDVWLQLSSVLEYKQMDLQIPTINIVGALVKSGVPVLVYR